MIPNETLQTIQTDGEGVKAIGHFDFDESTKARILQSISDKIYTNKPLAIIREYPNNGSDAQLEAGKPVSEMVITLPILTDLNYRVRDFGSGLSKDDILNIYCILGKSTKRNSELANGMLGYGCKSGFSCADSFTVTSWHSGEKTIYNCIKGDSQRLNRIVELSRSPSDEPTGIEVCIPIKQDMMWRLHREAADYFKYWAELPTIINMENGSKERMTKFRNTAATLQGEGWNIRPRCDGNAVAVAFMGGVSYRIDWNTLDTYMAMDSKKRVLFDLLQRNDVTLFYGMGEVNFVDSRESLEYTELTLKALCNRIESIFSKIQESIQEKFDPAPNIWEAKMIYNAIFGTGIIEVDEDGTPDTATKIKILDGNLSALESSYKNAFVWKGVPLNDSGFHDINKFDNADTSVIGSTTHDPIEPVMVTYRRKKKRAKICRCTAEANDRIVASNQCAVVLNDTGVKSANSAVARYLIFKTDSRIRAVHILNFKDDVIKGNFYNEYAFDTVPVIKLSEVFADAKAWVNANKTTRSYSSGGGGGGTRVMQYIDVDTSSVEENEVPIRDMEDGGIFILMADSCRRRRGGSVQMRNGYSTLRFHEAAENFSKLIKETGIDLSRIYVISKQTAETKWFNQAKASGDWINVWDYVAENIELDIPAIVDAHNYKNVSPVCAEIAIKLKMGITNAKSPMLPLISCVTDTNYDTNKELIVALNGLYLWDSLVGSSLGTVDFQALAKIVNEQYPFLEHYSYKLENDARMEDEVLAQIIKYINCIDFYENWGNSDVPPYNHVSGHFEKMVVVPLDMNRERAEKIIEQIKNR